MKVLSKQEIRDYHIRSNTDHDLGKQDMSLIVEEICKSHEKLRYLAADIAKALELYSEILDDDTSKVQIRNGRRK